MSFYMVAYHRFDSTSAHSDQCLCCSTLSLVSIAQITTLSLAPVTEQAGLSLALSEPPETSFVTTRLK